MPYIPRVLLSVALELATMWLLFLGLDASVRHGLLVKDPVEYALGCSTPCIVGYSPGGYTAVFQAAGDAFRAGSHDAMIINGPCYSACTMAADRAWPNVCTTKHALFGYHQARLPRFIERLLGGEPIFIDAMDYYSERVRPLLTKKGGLPKYGLLYLSPQDVRAFIPPCPDSLQVALR